MVAKAGGSDAEGVGDENVCPATLAIVFKPHRIGEARVIGAGVERPRNVVVTGKQLERAVGHGVGQLRPDRRETRRVFKRRAAGFKVGRVQQLQQEGRRWHQIWRARRNHHEP